MNILNTIRYEHDLVKRLDRTPCPFKIWEFIYWVVMAFPKNASDDYEASYMCMYLILFAIMAARYLIVYPFLFKDIASFFL